MRSRLSRDDGSLCPQCNNDNNKMKPMISKNHYKNKLIITITISNNDNKNKLIITITITISNTDNMLKGGGRGQG